MRGKHSRNTREVALNYSSPIAFLHKVALGFVAELDAGAPCGTRDCITLSTTLPKLPRQNEVTRVERRRKGENWTHALNYGCFAVTCYGGPRGIWRSACTRWATGVEAQGRGRLLSLEPA